MAKMTRIFANTHAPDDRDRDPRGAAAALARSGGPAPGARRTDAVAQGRGRRGRRHARRRLEGQVGRGGWGRWERPPPGRGRGGARHERAEGAYPRGLVMDGVVGNSALHPPGQGPPAPSSRARSGRRRFRRGRPARAPRGYPSRRCSPRDSASLIMSYIAAAAVVAARSAAPGKNVPSQALTCACQKARRSAARNPQSSSTGPTVLSAC